MERDYALKMIGQIQMTDWDTLLEFIKHYYDVKYAGGDELGRMHDEIVANPIPVATAWQEWKQKHAGWN